MDFQIIHAEPLYSVTGFDACNYIQLYGRTRAGESVSLLVEGIESYFYFSVGSEYGNTASEFVLDLNCKLKRRIGWDGCRRYKCKCENCPNKTADREPYMPRTPCFDPCMYYQRAVAGDGMVTLHPDTFKKKPLVGFTARSRTYYRADVARPHWLSYCKSIIQKKVKGITLFEAHIDPVTRFMTDNGLVGCGWVTFKPNGREMPPRYSCTSAIQHVVHARDLTPLEEDGCAPLRILAFDIECVSPSGDFPEAHKIDDQVIQISAVTLRYGQVLEGGQRHVFVLNGCDPIGGVFIHNFTSERDLLADWKRFIMEEDPDIISGYNSNQFDMPYLFDRAAKLDIKDFACQGKIMDRPRVQYRHVFQSAQTGALSWERHLVSGRVYMDIYELIRKGTSLRSYKLNDVSETILGDKKEDVSYREILPLHRGSPADRRKLAQYCLQDSVLVMKLILKMLLVTNNVELARVTGIQLSQVWEKGQTYRVESQVLRFTGRLGYLIPTFVKDYEAHRTIVNEYDDMHRELNARRGRAERGSEPPEFIGATVIEPDCGYYANSPIATLDFASLYPSIMMRHNLSFDTLIFTNEHAAREQIGPDDWAETPNGYRFVTRERKKGILPMILENLLDRRKMAKRAMKEATDAFTRGIMNGRQLALKMCANSVYGYCGSPTCAIPCQGISTGVTSHGRKMIFDSKAFVEARHPDCKVIYGDTDSIMIKFPAGTTVATAIVRAKGMETQFVEEGFFAKPVFLEYEKVFFPFLLLKKKKYVAYKFENDPTVGKIDAKGIEMVRRDNCLLVSKTQKRVIDILLRERDIDGAIKFLTTTLRCLAMGEVDRNDLVVSKALKKWDYVNPQPHATLAEKLKARNPADPPRLGDRIPFVILRPRGGRDTKIYNRAEDPAYAALHNKSIDVHYYIHQQMKKPFLRIFEQIIGMEEALKLFVGEHVIPRNMPHLLGFVQMKGGKRKRERHYTPLSPSAPKSKPKKKKGVKMGNLSSYFL